MNFEHSINSKDQLRGLYNYLNQKLITTINNIDDSTLEGNLITRQQVLIPVEVVENDQENMAPRAFHSNKVKSVKSLVE